jgi:hypothetical protein
MSEEERPNVHHASADLAAASDMQITVTAWHWFSHDQALTAANLSRRCGELEVSAAGLSDEERAAGTTWESYRREHRACAIASIVASASLLETSINELYASASHENLTVGGGLGGLTRTQRDTLIDVADPISGNKLLDKFQLTLRLLNLSSFVRGQAPYQDAQTLVFLRNSLVHYKPKFREVGSEEDREEQRTWQRLAGKRRSENPFTGQGNPFFPDRCLSHGYTTWAWETALTFCDDFFMRVGVEPPYGPTRAEYNS